MTSSLSPTSRTEPLLELARAGDPRAWSVLVERYQVLLLVKLELGMPGFLRRTSSPEDVLQDVLLKVAQRLDTFRYDGEGSFLRWLIQIVRNEVKNLQRHWLAEQDHLKQASGDVVDSLPGNLPTPSQALSRIHEQQHLLESMRALSAEDQDVLALHHFGDLSWEEIGDAIGCSRETAKRRYDRAIARMGRLMS